MMSPSASMKSLKRIVPLNSKSKYEKEFDTSSYSRPGSQESLVRSKHPDYDPASKFIQNWYSDELQQRASTSVGFARRRIPTKIE